MQRPLYPNLGNPEMTVYEAYKHANESARMLLEQIRTQCINEMITDPSIMTSWERLNTMLQLVDQLVDVADSMHIDTTTLVPNAAAGQPVCRLLN